MRLFIILGLLIAQHAYGQSVEIGMLEKKREEIRRIVRAYEDSLLDLDYLIADLKSSEFDDSIDQGTLMLYSKSDAPLRAGPSNFDRKIMVLPYDTRLRIVGKEGIYYKVESPYGNGFVSGNLTKGMPEVKSVATTHSNPTRTSRSRSNSRTSGPTYTSNVTASRTTNNSNTRTTSGTTTSSSTARRYYTGPRGGCYYINSNGNKSYVDRTLCGRPTNGTAVSSYRSSSRSLYRGPRGGCYYINSNGNKTYVARSKCN